MGHFDVRIDVADTTSLVNANTVGSGSLVHSRGWTLHVGPGVVGGISEMPDLATLPVASQPPRGRTTNQWLLAVVAVLLTARAAWIYSTRRRSGLVGLQSMSDSGDSAPPPR
jgi:hypothetical protein